jgi:hypothetical protein
MTPRNRRSATVSDFEQWIAQLIAERYETAGNLAKQIGMTDSGFSKAVRKGTLSVEMVLRLAREVGEPPNTVLLRAGKHTMADLLDELFGEPTARPSPDELKLLRVYRQVPVKVKALMLQVGTAFLAIGSPPP